MSSKTQTSSNQTQNTASTATPNVPTWISNPSQALAGQVSALQAGGPAAYTPGESALQSGATANAYNLQLPGQYNAASNALTGMPQVSANSTIDPVTGQSLLTNLSAYENPYQSQVINPVLAQYDQQAAQTQAAQQAAAAQTGAFGGSRYGVAQALTAGQLAMGRASTQGGLLNQMYDTATGLSAQDAANRQAAELATQQGQEFMAGQNLTAQQANQQAALQQGSLLTGLAASMNQQNQGNIALQSEIGGQQTALQNQISQYPLQYQAQLESLLQGLNPSLFTGQSTTGTGQSSGTSTTTQQPGLLQALGGLTSAASMFAPGGGAGALSMFNPFSSGGSVQGAAPEFY
jgi:hypothetical protein